MQFSRMHATRRVSSAFIFLSFLEGQPVLSLINPPTPALLPGSPDSLQVLGEIARRQRHQQHDGLH